MKTTSTEVEEDVYFEKEKLSFSIEKDTSCILMRVCILINLSLPSVLFSGDSIKT